jgi:hypothetical protein
MQVWLGADGRLRGVVSLDAVTTHEFRDAFRRWSVSITSVKAGDLADAVYAAVSRVWSPIQADRPGRR